MIIFSANFSKLFVFSKSLSSFFESKIVRLFVFTEAFSTDFLYSKNPSKTVIKAIIQIKIINQVYVKFFVLKFFIKLEIQIF